MTQNTTNSDDSTRLVYHNPETSCALLNKLALLQKSHTFCDVVVQVEKREFYAHKNVLGASSEYLLSCLVERHGSGDPKRVKGKSSRVSASTLDSANGMDILKLSGISADSFDNILKYFYTSSLDVDMCDVADLYMVATMLRVAPVVEICSQFLSNNLSVSNITNIRENINESQNNELCTAADSFIRTNAEVIVASSDMVKPQINVDVLIDVRPNLALRDNLAELVIGWLESLMDTTKASLEEFAEKRIVLYLTPGNSLIDCRELSESSLSNVALVKDYIVTAQAGKQSLPSGSLIRTGVANLTSRCKARDASPMPSQAADAETCLIAVTNAAEDYSKASCVAKVKGRLSRLSLHIRPLMELADSPTGLPPSDVMSTCSSDAYASSAEEISLTHPREDLSSSGNGENIEPYSDPALWPVNGNGGRVNSLEHLATMQDPRSAAGVAIVNGQVVLVGGYNRGECMNTVEMFCLETNAWKKLPKMTSPRGRLEAVELNGEIYAIGGSNGIKDMSSVEKLNLESDQWTPVANMLQDRSSLGAASIDGRIYVVGGCSGAVCLRNMEVFDPAVGEWMEQPPLPSPMSQAAVCTLNGLLYVVGGMDKWTCLSTAYVFDPVTARWATLPSLSRGRRGATLIPYSDKLFLIGGSDGSNVLSSMEVLDLTLPCPQWCPGPSLNLPRVNLAGISLVPAKEDRLLAVGGFNGKHFLDSIELLDLSAVTPANPLEPLQSYREWCMFLPASAVANGNRRKSSSGGTDTSNGSNEANLSITLR